MEHLPIDIHSNKLLDWLISRRHCPKNWRPSVEDVKIKISHAIQDMPENEAILAILSIAQYINYFHCIQIVDILRDTEKETKNIFGIYSSQRMKDWKEIISLYEQNNVYLAEAANFLQRFVQYEVPALRKQIAKAENTAKESERKQRDYAKQAAEVGRNLERELAKWALSVQVKDLRGELLAVAHATQPTELIIVGTELGRMVAYFDAFSNFVGRELHGIFSATRFLLPLPEKDGTEISMSDDSGRSPLLNTDRHINGPISVATFVEIVAHRQQGLIHAIELKCKNPFSICVYNGRGPLPMGADLEAFLLLKLDTIIVVQKNRRLRRGTPVLTDEGSYTIQVEIRSEGVEYAKVFEFNPNI